MRVKNKVNDTYAIYETGIKKAEMSDEELSVQLSVSIYDAYAANPVPTAISVLSATTTTKSFAYRILK